MESLCGYQASGIFGNEKKPREPSLAELRRLKGSLTSDNSEHKRDRLIEVGNYSSLNPAPKRNQWLGRLGERKGY